MVIFEEAEARVVSHSGRTGSCWLQDAAPQESPGQKHPRWGFMEHEQHAELLKIIITFTEHAVERKGGDILGEEMDHDTR